jgi:hypothetical protein
MKREGAGKVRASLAGTLFVLSGPVVESFYTTTKIEPLQVLLILGTITLASLTATAGNLARIILLAVLTGLAAFLAYLCKETTLVMLPIILAWLAGAWLWKASRLRKNTLAVLLAAFTAAALGFWLARGHYVISQGPGYAAQYHVQLAQILQTAYRWGGWLIRDFPYLLPCLLFLGWRLWRRRPGLQAGLLFASGVWMAGWAAIFMPWIFTVEYYILPFAAGCAVFSGLLIGDMLDLARSPARNERRWGAVVLALALLLFATTLPNNYSNGRLQLVIDAENERLLDWLAASVPHDGRVLINLDTSNAYVDHIQRHLQVVRGRDDIIVLPFSGNDAMAGDYILSFSIRNQPMFFVRLGTEEHSARVLNSRLSDYLGSATQPLYSTQASYRQLNINLVRLACPAVQLDFCADSTPLIDTRPLTYGGAVYQVPQQ